MLPMGIDFIRAIIKDQVVYAAPIHKPSFILVGSCNVRFWTLELGGPRFGSCLYSSETSICFLSYNNEDKHPPQRTVGRTRDTCLAWLLEWLISSRFTCAGVDAVLAKMSASSRSPSCSEPKDSD